MADWCTVFGVVNVPCEPLFSFVEPIKPLLGPDPEHAWIVDAKGENIAVAETVGIINLFFIHGDRVSVVFIEARFSTDPHKALIVLDNGIPGVLRQALFDGEMTEPKLIFQCVKRYKEA